MLHKFDDRSQEETERQERDAREAAWKLAENILKIKGSVHWCLPAPPTLHQEEREFCVDSGASMHMISNKDLNSADLETLTT